MALYKITVGKSSLYGAIILVLALQTLCRKNTLKKKKRKEECLEKWCEERHVVMTFLYFL